MSESMSAALARNWWVVVTRGIASLLFGLIALLLPTAALLTLAWLFSAYLLVDGALAVTASIRAAERHERWGYLLLEGIVDLLVGAAVFFFPSTAIVAFAIVAAAWALITGALMLMSAFRLHHTHGRFWLGLGGVVSLIWGILLATAPFTGAIVLTWWLGAYALIFGVSLILLGLRLHNRRPALTR